MLKNQLNGFVKPRIGLLVWLVNISMDNEVLLAVLFIFAIFSLLTIVRLILTIIKPSHQCLRENHVLTTCSSHAISALVAAFLSWSIVSIVRAITELVNATLRPVTGRT